MLLSNESHTEPVRGVYNEPGLVATVEIIRSWSIWGMRGELGVMGNGFGYALLYWLSLPKAAIRREDGA